MTEITKDSLMTNQNFFPTKPTDHGKFFVISLGTGSAKVEQKFSAQESAKWGVLGWLFNKNAKPLVNIFMKGSADMIDIHASAVFQSLRSEKNYLRIQDDTLVGNTSSTDISTKENLFDLVQVGKTLLTKQVSRVNLETGIFEPVEGEGTNEQALTHFAKMLCEERRQRKGKGR